MMKKIVFALLLSFMSYAAVAEPQIFPPAKWSVKNSADVTTIQNGTAVPMVVMISVDATSADATVSNCGSTQKIKAGSSAVCYTADPGSPITLTSTSSSPSSGTYQISIQLQ